MQHELMAAKSLNNNEENYERLTKKARYFQQSTNTFNRKDAHAQVIISMSNYLKSLIIQVIVRKLTLVWFFFHRIFILKVLFFNYNYFCIFSR